MHSVTNEHPHDRVFRPDELTSVAVLDRHIFWRIGQDGTNIVKKQIYHNRSRRCFAQEILRLGDIALLSSKE